MTKYLYTIDQTGHSEAFIVCDENHRQMAYLEHDDDPESEKQAEDDAMLIVDALNAFRPQAAVKEIDR